LQVPKLKKKALSSNFLWVLLCACQNVLQEPGPLIGASTMDIRLAFQFGRCFHFSKVFKVFQQAVEEFFPLVAVDDVTALELDSGFHLVAFLSGIPRHGVS
jgi:hypothetical protein